MTDKKQIVEAINKAFETNDIEGVLAHCTDDFTFAMVGHKAARGKEEARAFMSGMGDSEPPQFTADRIIVAEDAAVCYGDMKMKEEGGQADYSYCDVYTFQGDKVSELRAFVVRHQNADAGAEKAAA